MRSRRWLVRVLLVGLVAAGASACGLLESKPNDPEATTAAAEAPLTFSFTSNNGQGVTDQILTISNAAAVAKAPVLVITPLDADGAEVADIVVQTAFGSDTGLVVVPADTEVIDILRFKGDNAAEVADVRVDVRDEGVLAEDLPAANDLVVDRFDSSGEPSTGRASAISVANTYDAPITVRIVGVEYAGADGDGPQQFRRLTELAGAVTIKAGGVYDLKLPRTLARRTFGSINAYLTPS